jgi:hypothetical protein
MEGFDDAQRQVIITKIVSLIEEKREKVGNTGLDYHDKFEKYVLNYFEKKLIEVY